MSVGSTVCMLASLHTLKRSQEVGKTFQNNMQTNSQKAEKEWIKKKKKKRTRDVEYAKQIRGTLTLYSFS